MIEKITMNVEEKLKLISEVGEEITTEEELKNLLETKKHPLAYDGFEPSGNIHIAQGILRAININKMTKTGIKFKMWVADWFAWMNNKMGGDLGRIQTVGEYLIEVWKAVGMDMDNVEFLWAKDVMADENYWKLVVSIARINTVARIKRCAQIMGREESDSLSAAQIFYPCMQCADIFHLKADITQLGMDQRKVNMLAREVGPKLGLWKPVIISHHMLMGLGEPSKEKTIFNVTLGTGESYPLDDGTKIIFKGILPLRESVEKPFESVIGTLIKGIPIPHRKIELEITGVGSLIIEETESKSLGERITITCNSVNEKETSAYLTIKTQHTPAERAIEMKMSKSKPETAIFMTDSAADIERKIINAYCPDKRIIENPILEYMKYIIFEKFKEIKIERPSKFGGDIVFNSYKELEKTYGSGDLHPLDLKRATSIYVDKLIDPVRKHFATNKKAKDLLEQVKSFQVTR